MDTVGRRCPCNGLITNIGLPQPRAEREELPLLTSGFDVASITALIGPGGSYTAAAVIEHLLAGCRRAVSEDQESSASVSANAASLAHRFSRTGTGVARATAYAAPRSSATRCT